MPSYTMLHVKIHRESGSVPWGFRLQGGMDNGSPLQIQRVNPNSLAERCGMRADDYILRIGAISAEFLLHHEAQEHIKRQNNILELVLQRGSAPTSADYNNRVNFPSHSATSSRQTSISVHSQHQYSSQPQYQPPQPYYEPLPPQHHPPQPQIVVPLSNNRVLTSHTYNSPIGLYSAENVAETLEHTLKSINITGEHKHEEQKGTSEYTAAATTSTPKPVTQGDLQQAKVLAQPESHQSIDATSPPQKHATQVVGLRIIKKNPKGSALLSHFDKISYTAVCYACGINIRGPFISAIDRCYCVDHFTCGHCGINLMECGFVEENDKLYCEHDFELYFAPICVKCGHKILQDCMHAMEKTWHPECFVCTACRKRIGTGAFHIEEGHPYCIDDYQRMFQSKCVGCEFPIEPGDRYLEAMGGVYHAECFTCSACQVSLDGQPFVAKNNRPYCRQHGRPTFAKFN